MQVTLIDKMGTDALVVDSARVSFSKEASNYSEEQNAKLIKYLATHGHFTPFTHPQIVVREKVPIFVARQRFKHTVGFSYNEVSRRYVDDKPEFHYPEEWRSRPDGSMKQGSGETIIERLEYQNMIAVFGEGTTLENDVYDIHQEYKDFINRARRFYDLLILNDVAPEQARMVLPQSMMTEYYVTGSLAAWARAYKLRIDPHAQKEIRDVAVEWDKVIRPLFPISWSALVD